MKLKHVVASKAKAFITPTKWRIQKFRKEGRPAPERGEGASTEIAKYSCILGEKGAWAPCPPLPNAPLQPHGHDSHVY